MVASGIMGARSGASTTGSGSGAGAGFGAVFFFLGFLDAMAAPPAAPAQHRQQQAIRSSHIQVRKAEPEEPEPVAIIETEKSFSNKAANVSLVPAVIVASPFDDNVCTKCLLTLKFVSVIPEFIVVFASYLPNTFSQAKEISSNVAFDSAALIANSNRFIFSE